MIESPIAFSNDDQTSENQFNELENIKFNNVFDLQDDLKSSLVLMVQAQTQTLKTIKQFMQENIEHQNRIFELVSR